MIVFQGYPDDGDEAEVWYTTVQIDLATLKRATDNFSDEYTLGKGGFGSVYKVKPIIIHLIKLA